MALPPVLMAAALAATPSTLAGIDRAIQADQATLARIEGNWLALAGTAAALALAPPGPARDQRLAAARGWAAGVAPRLAARARPLRQRLAGLRRARADLIVHDLVLAAGGPTLRTPTRDLAGCATGSYRSPVAGPLLGQTAARALGRDGATLVAVPGDTVVAPARARVAFAGRFRHGRALVVLDHGSGWASLLTGIERIAVRPGAVVAAGEPLAQAAAPGLVGLELLHGGAEADAAARLAGCR